MVLALSLTADAIWILIMAFIASTSRAAMRRVPVETRVPMQFDLKKGPTWRAPRNLAFGFMIGFPLILGLVLLYIARTAAPEGALLIFLVRFSVAPVFALAHMAWLRAAMEILDREGALKP